MSDLPAQHFREPGIYIGLPEADYHASRAIGGSGFKAFVYQEIEFWWESDHNPYRPDRKVGEAADFGSAVHALLLEGREAYESRFYAESFDPDAHPGALATNEDMRAALRELGLPVGGNKPVLRERLEDAGFDGGFMDDLRAEWEAEREGRTRISPKWWNRLALFAAIRERDPKLVEIFSEGLPEVSVFWMDKGLRCRARFDWLRRDATYDVKTYSAREGQLPHEAMSKAVQFRRYDLQEAHYRAARAAMPSLPVFGGTPEQQAYVEACMAEPDPGFTFLFAKTQGAPIVSTYDADILRVSARSDYLRTMDRIRQFTDHFGGLGEPWVPGADHHTMELEDVFASFGIGAAA